MAGSGGLHEVTSSSRRSFAPVLKPGHVLITSRMPHEGAATQDHGGGPACVLKNVQEIVPIIKDYNPGL